MIEVNSLLSALARSTEDPSALGAAIHDLHDAIFGGRLAPTDDVTREILADLAYDLDYYEPDVNARKEGPYLNSDEAICRIREALSALRRNA